MRELGDFRGGPSPPAFNIEAVEITCVSQVPPAAYYDRGPPARPATLDRYPACNLHAIRRAGCQSRLAAALAEEIQHPIGEAQRPLADGSLVPHNLAGRELYAGPAVVVVAVDIPFV